MTRPGRTWATTAVGALAVRSAVLFATLGVALGLGACGEKRDPFQSGLGDVEGAVTYEEHVRALLERHCTRCHASDRAGGERQGAPADVNLDTYEDAVEHVDRANVRIQSDTMPPGGGELTDDERALFQAWIDQGTQRGEPGAPRTPTPPAPTPTPPTPAPPTSGILPPIPLPPLFASPPPTPLPGPTATPGGPVTYEHHVKPFLDAACVPCHDSSKSILERRGAPLDRNFDTYEGAVASHERANARIQAGTMPPDGSGIEPPTDEEKRQFQQWIDDGLLR